MDIVTFTQTLYFINTILFYNKHELRYIFKRKERLQKDNTYIKIRGFLVSIVAKILWEQHIITQKKDRLQNV